MQSLWIYDRDLLRVRREALLLGLVNLGIAGFHIFRHNWAFAATCGFWVGCCWLWRRMIDAEQATRDQRRRIESALHEYHRGNETKEI